jgi:hypothetical protein
MCIIVGVVGGGGVVVDVVVVESFHFLRENEKRSESGFEQEE